MASSVFASRLNVRRFLLSGFLALQAVLVSEVVLTVPQLPSAKAALAQNQSLEAAEDAVVFVETDLGSGSGIIVDAGGYIVTNAHVVEGARSIKVVIQGRAVPADVVALGSSNCLDLALLKVANHSNLPAITFGEIADVSKAQPVFAIGYPGIVPSASATVTQGIVSNLLHAQGLVLFDGEIHPGNSGGAVVNSNGELIGVATGRVSDSGSPSSESMSLAVSVDKVMAFVDSYRRGYSPVIGYIVMPGNNPSSDQLEHSISLDGQTIAESLKEGDSFFCEDGSLADVYTFEAEAGQGILIEMLGEQMGAFLMLISPTGEVLATNGTENANQAVIVLEKLPEAGTYTVLANAYQPEDSGNYQLRASEPVLVEQGALDRSAPPCFDSGERCREYYFQAQANQTVTVVLEQAEFDPYLVLLDTAGNIIAEGQTERDAVMNFTLLEEGWYSLLVSSVEADAGGRFIVSVHDTETLMNSQEVSQR